jgi:hypothetical protein
MDITLLVITLLSLLLAAAMSVVAWRMVADERLRSSARVAALAAEIHGEPQVSLPTDTDMLLQTAAPSASGVILSPPSGPTSPSRLTLMATVAALVVGLATAVIVFGRAGAAGAAGQSNGPDSGARHLARPAAQGGALKAPALPLELIALGHERDARGLTVRGVLRNPSGASELSHLTAVVLLFNREGSYIASGRAAVKAATLGPGDETTFVVTVSDAPGVERYRVSFRTDSDVVPHVDVRS